MNFSAYHGKVIRDSGAGRLTRMDISPVASLPVELLQEIFVMTRWPNFFKYIHRDGQESSAFDATPLAIVQTCSKWRSIGLVTPALWAAFYTRGGIKEHVPYAQLYLRRSGNAPLILKINNVGDWHTCTETTAQLLEIWVPHAHRWQDIYFYLGENLMLTNFPVLFSIPPAKLNNLHHAVIHPLRSFDPLFANVWKLFYATQGTLCAKWGEKGFQPLLPAVPAETWNRLSDLSLNSITMNDLLSFIDHCGNLERLEVLNLIVNPTQISSAQVSLIPKLQTLIFATAPWESVADDILNVLILPRLSTLEVTQAGNSSLDVYALRNLLVRSDCVLRRLSLGFRNEEEPIMNQYLANASQFLGFVESFFLHAPGDRITHQTIKLLSPCENKALLPSLLELSLWGCTTPDGLIGQLLLDLFAMGSPLLAFDHLFNIKDESYHIKDEGIFEEMKKKGLILDWRCT